MKSINFVIFVFVTLITAVVQTKCECIFELGATIPKGWSCKAYAGRIHWQEDGNLVIFDEKDKAIWMSNTWTHPVYTRRVGDRLEFQKDGNLVIYNTDNRPTWKTGTERKRATHLIFQDGRNLVVYIIKGSVKEALWASGTSSYFYLG